eukprot:6487623-Amphidinium_carterae.1
MADVIHWSRYSFVHVYDQLMRTLDHFFPNSTDLSYVSLDKIDSLVAPYPEHGICGQPSPAIAVYILFKMRAADIHTSADIVS